jgi:delta8-fatty-acid desaturase
MIADGRKLIILDQYVVKADPWLTYHPGGDKAILHMVGKDATDEITVLVPSPAQTALLPVVHDS